MADVVVTVGGAAYTFDFLTNDGVAAASGIANAISAESGASTDVVSADGTTFVPSADNAIVINALGPAVVVAASSVSVIGGSGGVAFYGAPGATENIALAGGANTVNSGTGTTYNITTGSGDDVIYATGSGSVDAGAGSNTILAGAGSQEIISYGVGDLISLASGSTTVGSGGSNALIFGGSGADVLADTGTADTVVGGTGAMTTFGGTQGLYFLSSSSNLVVAGNSSTSSDTIVGATGGAETVFGGTADVVFTNASSLTYVAGNNGVATILGGSSSTANVFGAQGASINFYSASAGAGAILTQGEGNETISAATSEASVTFVGGSGSASLVGGMAADTFVFSMGGGSDTIGQATASDIFVIAGFGSGEVANDLANATHSNGNTSIITSDGAHYTFTDVSTLTQTSDTSFSASCFFRGTCILTPRGEVPIENLATGDIILTAEGAEQRICWLARQTVSKRFGDPLRVLPIRIRAGMLGEGLPTRDLLLSPDHAILIDGLLVQAGALVNGDSITREHDVPEQYIFYNIELGRHDLVLAEGMPVESFVDNVGRGVFDNWQEHAALYPDCAPLEEMPYPRVSSARQVPQEMRRRLRAAQVAA